jgi:hypothetical protein
MMRSEIAELSLIAVCSLDLRVRDPEALARDIDLSRFGLVDGFRGISAWEQGTMNHREGLFAISASNRFGENHGVLIVYGREVACLAFKAVARKECGQAKPFPIEQIDGARKGDSWSVAAKRSVRHQVTLQFFEIRDARVFASTSAGTELVISLWLECDAEALSAHWISIAIEVHARNSDAREVAVRDETRKKVEPSIRASRGCGVQDAVNLIWIARLGRHDNSEALQLEWHHILNNYSREVL